MHLILVTLGLFIVTVIAALILLPVRVHLTYRHDGHDDKLNVEYKAFGGLLVRRINTVPGRMKAGKTASPLSLTKKLGSHFAQKDESSGANQKEWLTFLLRKVKVEEIEWRTEIGTGDAAETGLLTGLLWALKGSIVSYYKTRVGGLKKKNIVVVPCYENTRFATNVNCIFTMRLGHIMLAGLKKATGERTGGGE